jgi:hypothetical protein
MKDPSRKRRFVEIRSCTNRRKHPQEPAGPTRFQAAARPLTSTPRKPQGASPRDALLTYASAIHWAQARGMRTNQRRCNPPGWRPGACWWRARARGFLVRAALQFPESRQAQASPVSRRAQARGMPRSPASLQAYAAGSRSITLCMTAQWVGRRARIAGIRACR